MGYTMDEWIDEPTIGLYSTMFTLGSVILFRGFSVVNRNNFHLTVGSEENEPSQNACQWSHVSALNLQLPPKAAASAVRMALGVCLMVGALFLYE